MVRLSECIYYYIRFPMLFWAIGGGGGLFQALFKPLAESNKNHRVYFQN